MVHFDLSIMAKTAPDSPGRAAQPPGVEVVEGVGPARTEDLDPLSHRVSAPRDANGGAAGTHGEAKGAR
jgi:hypothetical protein